MLQGRNHFLAFAALGLHVEQFLFAAEIALIKRQGFTQVRAVGGRLKPGRIDALGERQVDNVAAHKIDAVNLLALETDGDDADEDQHPRGDKRAPAELQEIHRRRPEKIGHDHPLHDAGSDRHIQQHLADDQGGEHRRKDADCDRDTEAFDRARAERDHEQRGDHGREVGVHDRRQRLLVAGVKRGRERFAEGKLLAHALEDQNVGIDRHADRQHDAGDAGHGQRRAEAGEHAEDDQDVERHARDGDGAGQRVVADHEGGDERDTNVGGAFAAVDGVGGERGSDLVLLLDLQFDVERVVEHVGEVARLAVGETAGDLRGIVVDFLADGRRRVEASVQHDGEAAKAARLLALRRDGAGDRGEFLPPLGGEFENDLGLAVLIDADEGIGNRLAGHFGPALHEQLFRAHLALAPFVFERHDLIADRRLDAGTRRKRRMHDTEIELRGRADVVDDVGVVAGVDAGQLDLDAVVPDLADQRLGDAEAVDARADDVDRLRELVGALLRAQVVARPGHGLEGERHAAVEVETELEPAFRAAEQLGEEDVVAFLDILERRLEPDVGKVLGEVDLSILADLLECHELARGLLAGLQRHRLGEERAEFGGFGGRVSLGIIDKRLVFQGEKSRDRPSHDGEGGDDLPEVASEHGWLDLNWG